MRKVALLVCLAFVSLAFISLPSIAQTETPAATAAAPAEIAAPAAAPADTGPKRLDCDALKARVDAKLQAKGVPVYTLEIVPAEGSADSINAASGVAAAKMNKGKQVGTCDGGTKRLMYTKGN